MSSSSVSLRRADTRRNRDRILGVAAAAVATGELSFNAVAKAAGVGVGTVYRHFPTQDALVLAVYEREVGHLIAAVPGLLADHTPEQAFRLWVTEYLAHYMTTKRGLAEALQTASLAAGGAYRSMVEAGAELLRANIAAGTVRPDTDPETVLRALGGLFFLGPDEAGRRAAEDLTELVWRGIAT
ncbi:TetR/AcrR family transcriptional regulator [Pseudonocardia oroxyli]|uniref:Transcriptional regulator, TetR family n=1 Tax=Pseudonocardia oroxyli TaxID=366584 RepID=A0A1G7P7I8_PSEOR|nr:TetR/AcrR family transcriptional regulator [Pseudonocardia oroxyli]SDF82107.1 transcriptional regulator, TetR family [Pseudonocardia oroxyli]